MYSVQVRDAAHRAIAQFAVLPIPSALSRADEYLDWFAYLARASGERFFFLVTADLIHGWVIGRDVATRPSFRCGTVEILGTYARQPSQVEGARDIVLAGLVETWLSDLATHWKSGANPAPGEDLLGRMGFLDSLRASATVGIQAP